MLQRKIMAAFLKLTDTKMSMGRGTRLTLTELLGESTFTKEFICSSQADQLSHPYRFVKGYANANEYASADEGFTKFSGVKSTYFADMKAKIGPAFAVQQALKAEGCHFGGLGGKWRVEWDDLREQLLGATSANDRKLLDI
jgi:hypothetical protein